MLTKLSRSNNMPNIVFKVDSLHEKLNQITKMYFSELQVIKTGSLLSVSEKEKDCPDLMIRRGKPQNTVFDIGKRWRRG